VHADCLQAVIGAIYRWLGMNAVAEALFIMGVLNSKICRHPEFPKAAEGAAIHLALSLHVSEAWMVGDSAGSLHKKRVALSRSLFAGQWSARDVASFHNLVYLIWKFDRQIVALASNECSKVRNRDGGRQMSNR